MKKISIKSISAVLIMCLSMTACGEKAALYDIDTLGREEFTRERALLLQQAQEIVEKYRQDLHKWESYRAQRISGC